MIDLSAAIGAGAGGGGIVVVLVRMLVSSWLREQKQRDELFQKEMKNLSDAVDRRVKNLSDAVDHQVKELERELAEMKESRAKDHASIATKQDSMGDELRRLSSKISFLNGQLVGKRIVGPGSEDANAI